MSKTRSYTIKKASDLVSALNICLQLRKRGLWSFRGQRNSSWPLGLHDTVSFEELDKNLEQFKRRCMEFPPPQHLQESDKWRWLFFAQHHRLKTCLLDWTKDPLVAIYFAVENIISGNNDNDECGAIWALKVGKRHFINPDQLNTPEDIHEWVLVNPPPFTPRLARQSGLFTYHPKGSEFILIDQIERRKENKDENEELIKIEIKPNEKIKNPTISIRQQLGILNVHHASLFPDPEGIAEFINLEWPSII